MDVVVLIIGLIFKLSLGLFLLLLCCGVVIVWTIVLIATENYLNDIIPNFSGKNWLTTSLSFILSPVFLLLFILGLLAFIFFLVILCVIARINYKLNNRLYKNHIN